MRSTRSRRAAAVEWTGRTLFGKWKAERVMGVGGTSTVLQARHRNGRRAALKILHPHLAAHERARERFLREGKLANLVEHPGVVAVLDDFVDEHGSAILVLELVNGDNLSARARASGGTLPTSEVIEAARAVLDILAVAHDTNVIHRDIKPENILRCSSGGYKLADFGLAGLAHELGMLTGTNVAIGTPAYMSPEQARADAHLDARTDLWGLGATMFTLLTGRYLHAGAAPRNLVLAAATQAAPSVRTIEPSIPVELADVIDRAVRMDRDERWPNARAMLSALSSISVPSTVIAGSGPSDKTAPSAETAPSSLLSWSRARTWLERDEPRSSLRLRGTSGAMVLAVLMAFLILWKSPNPVASVRGAHGAMPQARNGLPERSVTAPPSSAFPPGSLPSALAPFGPTPGRGERAVTEAPRRVVSRTPRQLPVQIAGPVASTAKATSAVDKADLSIPDEVLDRRR